MPTVKELEAFLFSAAPKDLAMHWDNVGLLVGQPEQAVRHVLVALDITEEVVQEAAAEGMELIVAHHPVMNCKWLPVQTVRTDTPQGRILMELIRSGISAICMHTNLDIAEGGVNDCLAQAVGLNVLEPLGADGCGRVGALPEEMAMDAFLPHVARALHCSGMRYVSAGKPVRRVAVGGGACWDYHADALRKKCDTFLTSDLSYHDFLDAKAMGMNVIDAGHFPTEDVVCPKLVSMLQSAYPQLNIKKSTSHREVFQYFLS